MFVTSVLQQDIKPERDLPEAPFQVDQELLTSKAGLQEHVNCQAGASSNREGAADVANGMAVAEKVSSVLVLWNFYPCWELTGGRQIVMSLPAGH